MTTLYTDLLPSSYPLSLKLEKNLAHTWSQLVIYVDIVGH